MRYQWTMARIRESNRRAGRTWFHPSHMRANRTRLSERVYQGPGGVYFVASEAPANLPREYRVFSYSRRAGVTRVTTKDRLTYRQAHNLAAKLAAEEK